MKKELLNTKGFTPLESPVPLQSLFVTGPAIYAGDERYKSSIPYRRDGVKAPSFLTGFTLLEVLVSAIILALVVAGMVNVFIVGKRMIVHSRSRMSGGELGKLFLAPLQGGVSADTWGAAGNPLQLGTRYCDSDLTHSQQPGCPTLGARTLDNIVYSAEYNITNATARTEPDNIRRVVAAIRWNEPTQ